MPGNAFDYPARMSTRSPVAFTRDRRRTPAPGELSAKSDILLVVVLASCWFRAVIPDAVNVLLAGRTPTGDVISTATGTLVAYLATGAIFATSTAAIILAPRRSYDGSLLTLALPIYAAIVSFVANSAAVSVAWIVYPIAALALSRVWNVEVAMRTHATATSTWAAMNMAVAFTLPSSAQVITQTLSDDKSPWGWVLAGLSLQSNVLAIQLAIGLGSLPALRSRKAALTGGAVVFAVVILTFSRTAIIASGITLVLLTLGRTCPSILRPIFVVGAWLAAATTCALPFFTQNPTAFSDRGNIWTSALANWRTAPIFGQGEDYFRDRLISDATAGRLATHGHNMLVEVLVTQGVFGAAATAILIYAAATRATRLAAQVVYLPAMLLPLLMLFILEGAFSFQSSTGISFWIALLAPILTTASVPVDSTHSTDAALATPARTPPRTADASHD